MRGPSSAGSAAATNEQINFERTKALGKFHVDFRKRLVETESLAARLASEMRVMAVRSGFGRCLLWVDHEPPHPVVARDAMGNTLIHQPFQYPVDGDTINGMVIDEHASDIQMRCRALACQQAGQHRNARLREALAGGADGGFGGRQMGEVGGLHGELHLTRCEWQLQLSRMEMKWRTLALVRGSGRFMAGMRAGWRSASLIP